MNCKQDDLAIIVESSAGNEGLIVQCVRYFGTQTGVLPNGDVQIGHVWEIDQTLMDWSGSGSRLIFDSQLFPLRKPGENETDETLVPGYGREGVQA